MQGTIASLQPDRDFGFSTANGEEFFFHRSALLGVEFAELAEGLTATSSPNGARTATNLAKSRGLAELELRPVGGERAAPTSQFAAAKAPNLVAS